MDGTPDIRACRRFVNYLRQNFTSNYNLDITKLSLKLERLINGNGHVLIFYLHQSQHPFSQDFCSFLRNPQIEEAFRKDNFVLYGWDVTDDNEKDDLILSFVMHLEFEMANYIVENKSVAFCIVSQNNSPLIFKVIDTSEDLESLGDILLENAEESSFTPLDFQQSMESLLKDDDYTSYEREDHGQLKSNIKYALYGPPRETEEEIRNRPPEEQEEIRRNITRENEAVDEMFKKILETNNKYCKWKGRVVIKIIYICAVTLPREKAKKAKECANRNERYNPDSDFVTYPVFILRKCKHRYDPLKACRIFIDTETRAYKSWDDFLKDNKLPPVEIFYPDNGRYLPDNTTTYKTKLSPACDLLTRAAAATDVAAGVTGVLAGGVSIAGSSTAVIGAVPFMAAAAPIAVPIAAAVGIGSALYALGRSINTLVDRRIHQQEINVQNAESRSAYLNIAGSVVSLGMFGAIRTVSFLAGRGFQLGQGTRYFLYGLNGINLTVGGMGIANAIHQVVRSRTRSTLVIAQLGASILFFAHSVYSFRSIGTVIEESQNRSLSEIELSLRSNRHRRTFNKLLKESIRTQGEARGKASVISSIRKMENVDDVLAVLTRSNKMLNREGIRFSAAGDQIMLNGRPVDMMNFGSMSRSSQTSFLETFPPIPENLSPNVRSIITADVNHWISGLEIMGRFISQRDINQLVNDILSAFNPVARDYILDITKRLCNSIDERVLRAFANKISNSFIKLMKWVCNELINNDLFQRILGNGSTTERLTQEEVDSIVQTLESDFNSMYTNYEYDEELRALRKARRRVGNPVRSKIICDCCGGYYYV